MNPGKSYKRQRSLALLPRPDSPIRLPALDSSPTSKPLNRTFGRATDCEEVKDCEYRGKTRALIRRVEVFFSKPDIPKKDRKNTQFPGKNLWWPMTSLSHTASAGLKPLLKGHNPSRSFDLSFKPVFISGQRVKQKTRTKPMSEVMKGHKRQGNENAVFMRVQREMRKRKAEIQRKPPCEVSLEGLLGDWAGIIKGD